MQSLIKTCALPVVLISLTACGGGGGGGSKPAPSPVPSSTAASSVAPSSVAPSSTPASSLAASSIAPASSADASSSAASSSVAGTESTQTATVYANYSVAAIDNCGVGIGAANKTFAIFADYDSGVQNQSLSSLNFSGWNHATNGSTTEWTNLKLAGSNYNFNNNAKVNSSCNSVDTLDMLLVKKINDWDHQHSNGFERNILAYGYKFGDIESLTVDVKINNAKTSIPSVASLKTIYTSYLDPKKPDAVENLEDGKVNIGIVIYDGKTASTWMAKKIIQLDQSALGDKWIRVTIPMSGMKHCLEANYNCADRPFSELSSKTIAGIQFVGETKSGAVLRGDISSWSTSIPETFKEADLSFKKIEFQLK
ncbi:hypothetical protein [Cellvibrio fibrivorans]|uniref:ExoP galactose-binding-like domain-containing protein n=1 Tax=Cellvibrio fibrivorans TaxID=126350 RepID=A0ABU1V372_9GAMM|nr:hypothetical protein [Cellvibrio fibrivorans]MDR7091892.1 hypothetical protein [Cellvibrio fibrivorans]